MAYDPTKRKPAVSIDQLLKDAAAAASARPMSSAYGPGAIAPQNAVSPIPIIAPQQNQITQAVKMPQPGQTTAPASSAAAPAATPPDAGMTPKIPLPNFLQGSKVAGAQEFVAGLQRRPSPQPLEVMPGYSPGMTPVNNAAGGVNDGQIYAGQSQRTGSVEGVPQFATNYATPQGTMSIAGPSQRMGGGTVSVMDHGNGGTVEGNVTAINRQIEALRSLREAQNPGILAREAGTTPPSLRDMIESADPYAGRTYQLDSMSEGQRAQANALRTASADEATKQFGAMERERAQGQATQSAARVTAQQKAQEAADRLGLDTGRLQLDAAKAEGESKTNSALKGAQSAKLATEAQQNQMAMQTYEKLLASSDPKERTELLKLLLAIQGKGTPVDPMATLLGAQ